MSESLRLETLRTRDGVEVAKQWARCAAELYRRSTGDPLNYASQPEWKPLFEQSIREMMIFAERGVIS